MKKIAWLFAFFLSFCAINADISYAYAASPNKFKVFSYSVSPEFEIAQNISIHTAAEYLSSEITCLYLEGLSYESYNFEVIKFVPMEEPPANIIGLFHPASNVVKLFVHQSEEMFYKTTLHEFAHALGMRGHAFEKELREESLLSPQISAKTKVELYKRDIDYLNNLLCE